MTIVAPVRELEIVEVLPLEQWRRDLLAAADWLEAHEWCQGAMVDAQGARCAAGAIEAVGAFAGDAYRELGLFTATAHTWCVPEWNDAPGRTKDEVISTMRACAMQP